jgi:peptidoglycan/LPS O-acetylase OafA/YrhL
MERPEANRMRTRRRIWPFVIGAGICLFVGFWGFAYQGYAEDAGSEPIQSWPIGVGGYILGGALTLLVIRRAWPRISSSRMLLAGLGVTALLVAAAIGAVDAGNV